MKRCLLFSTATILCCGFSSFASAQFSLTATPKLAPQLYLAQTSSEAPDQAENETDFDSPATPSPFDLFSDDTQKPSIPSDSNQVQAEISTEPSSTPVGRHGRSTSPADTIIAGSVALTGGYNRYATDWPQQQARTPNHTASYMMMQWCADGLWDNYAAERAQQCARQYERIAGRQHCGHCGTAGPSVQSNCQPCESGRPHGHCESCGQHKPLRKEKGCGLRDQSACQPLNCQPSCGWPKEPKLGHCGNFGHGKLFGLRKKSDCDSCALEGSQANCGCSKCSQTAATPSGCDCAQHQPLELQTQYANSPATSRPIPAELAPAPAVGRTAVQPLNIYR